jgi:hypothetical protein
MKVRFLLDENLDPRIITALLRRDPAIDIQRVGDPDAPPRATPDPDILRYAEQTQRLLVTNNRASMDVHLAAHYAAGGRHWRVFRLRDRASLGTIIEALYLLWAAREAEEWLDYTDWIP